MTGREHPKPFRLRISSTTFSIRERQEDRMRKAKVLDRRVYREGQVIFREGEQSWAAFMVESG